MGTVIWFFTACICMRTISLEGTYSDLFSAVYSLINNDRDDPGGDFDFDKSATTFTSVFHSCEASCHNIRKIPAPEPIKVPLPSTDPTCLSVL